MSLCGTDYAIGAVRNMYKESRQDNAMVVMPSKLQKGLPRRTGSLCPECLKVIPATLYIGDGALVEFACLLSRLLHLEGAVAYVVLRRDDLEAFGTKGSGSPGKPLLEKTCKEHG